MIFITLFMPLTSSVTVQASLRFKIHLPLSGVNRGSRSSSSRVGLHDQEDGFPSGSRSPSTSEFLAVPQFEGHGDVGRKIEVCGARSNPVEFVEQQLRDR